MTFWIQHGYGKADKIRIVAMAGSLTGVILSPADEERSSLEATASDARLHGLDLLLDPQLYVHTLEGASARYHDSNGLDFGTISWFVSPQEIAEHAQAVVNVNTRLGTSQIVAPAPYQASFGDVWTPLSLQYAQATSAVTDDPVYISIVADDTAFSDWHTTSEYLDALTTLDAAGIYLVVGTGGTGYPRPWEPTRLANVLRAIYTLAEFGQYKVLWGYSDIAGVLGLTSGAAGAATGWYNSLRTWSPQKWMPKTGGRQATPRIFVEPLLSVIERDTEARNIVRTQHATNVFPDPGIRQDLRGDGSWGIADSWNQHLITTAQLHQTIDQQASVSDRVSEFHQRLENAIALLADVMDAGSIVTPVYTNCLRSFVAALEIFVEEEGL